MTPLLVVPTTQNVIRHGPSSLAAVILENKHDGHPFYCLQNGFNLMLDYLIYRYIHAIYYTLVSCWPYVSQLACG